MEPFLIELPRIYDGLEMFRLINVGQLKHFLKYCGYNPFDLDQIALYSRVET